MGPWLCQKVTDSLAGQEERGLPVSSDSIKTLSTYTVYTRRKRGSQAGLVFQEECLVQTDHCSLTVISLIQNFTKSF